MDYIQVSRLKAGNKDNGLCETCKCLKGGCQAIPDGEYGEMFVVEECSGRESVEQETN